MKIRKTIMITETNNNNNNGNNNNNNNNDSNIIIKNNHKNEKTYNYSYHYATEQIRRSLNLADSN